MPRSLLSPVSVFPPPGAGVALFAALWPLSLLSVVAIVLLHPPSAVWRPIFSHA